MDTAFANDTQSSLIGLMYKAIWLAPNTTATWLAICITAIWSVTCITAIWLVTCITAIWLVTCIRAIWLHHSHLIGHTHQDHLIICDHSDPSQPPDCLHCSHLIGHMHHSHLISIVNSTIESAIWGLIARVTGTGKAWNCMRQSWVLFVLPVLVTSAILQSQSCYQLLTYDVHSCYGACHISLSNVKYHP